MSNLKEGENPSHRKSKVSWAMIIIPGLVGPKPRRISVGDGQRVNIPVPACNLLLDARHDNRSGFMVISV